VAVAIIVTSMLASSSFIKDQPDDIPNELINASNNSLQNIPMPESMKDDGLTYKINTQCEMMFGMLRATYPDGTPLPRLDIKSLLEKYPEEFKDWKVILEDPEKSKELAQNDPEGFNRILIPILMKESSITPDLESTAMFLVDPARSTKLKQVFEINNCQEFFDSHNNTSTP